MQPQGSARSWLGHAGGGERPWVSRPRLVAGLLRRRTRGRQEQLLTSRPARPLPVGVGAAEAEYHLVEGVAVVVVGVGDSELAPW
jgi:hypothetical protein